MEIFGNKSVDKEYTNEEILSAVDHTVLKQTATWIEVKTLCKEGVDGGAASVCIPPCYVAQAVEYLEDKLPVCTVIGFPNGNQTTRCKVFETMEAVENGASEIDMVINIGWVKEGNFLAVEEEIRQIREACKDRILKVIVETCFLTDAEKIKLCQIVTDLKADFIKTSTGFASAGAEISDVLLFKRNIGNNVGIKAAGGIRTVEDAKKFLDAGATRIGSSALIALLQ